MRPNPVIPGSSQRRRRSIRAPLSRTLVLGTAALALVMGLWTGLARAGVHRPVGIMDAHGILMVLGFLGTLMAIGSRWAYLAPASSGAASVWIVAGLPGPGAGVLLTVAGLVVTGVFGVTLWGRSEFHLWVMASGALAWVIAASLWTVGWSPARLAPTLAAFLVLTIVGERLELSRLRVPSPAVQRRLLIAATLFAIGVAMTLRLLRSGLAVAGLGLLAQTAWLVRHDVARVTIRVPGLPRYAVTCMLAGYAWLATAGALWL